MPNLFSCPYCATKARETPEEPEAYARRILDYTGRFICDRCANEIEKGSERHKLDYVDTDKKRIARLPRVFQVTRADWEVFKKEWEDRGWTVEDKGVWVTEDGTRVPQDRRVHLTRDPKGLPN